MTRTAAAAAAAADRVLLEMVRGSKGRGYLQLGKASAAFIGCVTQEWPVI
jgi:hypothetical protein